ncbi:MAG: hypothetical protein HY901_01615 [Deltaproteobacteria bacterium]|nr:hypothetical protein [Deltaproteobacteria bacterium]
MAESASMPARVKVGRRNFLIDRSFQLKYTLYMVIVGAAISLLFGAMMYQAHVEATQLIDMPDPLREAVKSQDATLLWLVMAIAVVMAVALGLFGILVTHRVAGPMYVFSHYMSVLGDGRFPMLRPLRKKDELKSFYEVFHGAVATMKERDKARGAELKMIAASIEEAAAKAPDAAAALKPSAEMLRAMADKLIVAASTEEPATPGQKAEKASRAA